MAAFLGMWGLIAASMAPALLIARMVALGPKGFVWLGPLAAGVLLRKAAPFGVACRPAFAVLLAGVAVVAWTI